MAVLYTTVAKFAFAEQTIEKSRFIAYIKPVNTREEAENFFEEINKKHKDARHCVPCFVIGDKMQLQWASDNGEPSGTAGPPMLQMLVKEGITNVALGVVRYFGGIKLGTGGLVRAYTSSARLALNAAGLYEVKEKMKLSTEIPYTALGKLKNNEKNMPFTIEELFYGSNISVTLSFDEEEQQKITAMLEELLNNKLPENTKIVKYII